MITYLPHRRNSHRPGGLSFDSDLILRYKFSEGSGSAVGDASGNGNDATLSGASWDSDVPSGSTGYSMSFDGANDTLISDASLTYNTDVTTVCFWAYHTSWPSGSGSEQIYSSASSTSGSANVFSSYYGWGELIARVTGNAGTGNLQGNRTDLADSTWIHLALVHINTSGADDLKFYADGVLDTTENQYINDHVGGGNFSANTLYIAHNDSLSDLYFGGKLHDFCIYNRELNASEIGQVKDNPDR